MFEALAARPPDAIIALMEQAKADANPLKIDLGVGVYKSDDGATPIMRAVKKAETLWLQEEQTKSYVSTIGNAAFRKSLAALIFGADNPVVTSGRMATAQAAGGSGALRLGAEIIVSASPGATIWVSTPTWANHIPLLSSAGLKLETYPYYNRETLGVDFDDMIAHLETHAKAGDVLLLHGCCHNPTGADLSHAQWDRVAQLLLEKDLTPYIDLAYFGLGRGMEDDTYGVKKVIDSVPECLVAASCSKNFALYKERVGLICIITKDPETAKIAESQLSAAQRKLVSMPPDHGAALVARVLGDPVLYAEWEAELTHMRERMIALRKQLSGAMNVQGGEAIAAAIKDQNGMFSTLPLSQAQAERLREKHSVYIMNSGRMNIAAANTENIPRLAEAILAVL
ncbi:MAG: aromatic amino acid transaminase [Alphaproteobacteria bacterium]